MAEVEVLWQKIRAADSKSLLKKHLTPDLKRKCKHFETKYGGTLADCIRSGCMNPDSGVGIYACDPEGYTVFASVLDKVIKDYHKVDSLAHPACDFGVENVKCGDLDPSGEMIVSTRVRVGRSHDSYGFPPVLTKNDRVEMEKKTVEALNTLPGDLQGTYYPLAGMSEKTQKQLTEDHFLFNDSDRFLRAASGYDDWPTGRGIFHNANKDFLAWVNEEDHMRFISMQMGGNLEEVYKRLVKAVKHLETKLSFAKRDGLGYLTFCPSNLGTTLRASVHIKIPKLAASPDFKAFCDKYNLQARGIHGEHTESVGGVYDISNKRRLGLTEYDAIEEMRKGVLAVIEEEKKLQREGGDELQKLWERLQNPPPDVPTNPNCLLKRHLSADLYDQLKGERTRFGGTLKGCIKSGCINPDSGVGIYACDPEGYTVFAPVLDKVIKDYHKVDTLAHPACDFGVEKVNCGDLDPSGEMIVSTRVRVGRSHDSYGFPPVLNKKDRVGMEKKTVDALNKLEGDLKGTYYPLAGMSKEDQKQLTEDHFLFNDSDRFLREASGYDDWPTGRGIFHNKNKDFLAWVNEEDHMRFISMQMGGNLEEVYKRLVKAVKHLEKDLSFAKRDGLGYLTFCPSNLGTTLRASVHIKIPKLAASPDFKAFCDKYNIQARGIHGEHTESVGGVYDISNKRRLGLTEYDAIEEMRKGVLAVIEEEKKLQRKADEEELQKLWERLQNPPPDVPTNPNCLLKRHLSADLYDQLKGERTRFGGTLKGCIKSGCINPDSGVGIYACDPEGYTVFAPVLDKVIKDYHKVDTLAHPACDFGVENVKCGDLDPSGEMIVSTRVRVGRSHDSYGFPPVLTKKDRVGMEKKTVDALNKLEGDLKGTYYPLAGMSKEDQKQLTEDHFLFNDSDRFLREASGYDDWPTGRGIFHNKNKDFLAWVNEEDHMRFISMQMGGNLEEVYKRLVKAVKHLEKDLSFAKRDGLGYLTFCPSNLGTTLRASVHIKIPKLAASPDFKAFCDKYNIQARGIHGEHTESVGGVYDISNKRRLGLTEYDAIEEMRKGVLAVIEEEKKLQQADTLQSTK